MAINKHVKYLKICNPDGTRIELNVFVRADKRLLLSVDYLEEVAKDKPAFAKNGFIEMVVHKSDYSTAIERLERYLESLFLKELAT